jgi:hypothetical protein
LIGIWRGLLTTAEAKTEESIILVLARNGHAHEVHTHQVHIHEMHAHEVHTYEMHAYEMHAHEMQTHGMHAYEMDTHEMRAYEGFYEDLACQNAVAQLSQLQLRFRRRHI